MTLDGIKRDLRARRDLTALYARALGKWLLLATAAWWARRSTWPWSM